MRPIRVLVADDSAVGRQVTAETLGIDAAIDVVGTASTGRLAVSKAASLHPDVVTVDGALRDGDALGTVRALKAAHPGVVVVLVTAPTDAGAALALAALEAGADDYVTEPVTAGGVAATQRALVAELVPRVKELARARRRLPLPPGVQGTPEVRGTPGLPPGLPRARRGALPVSPELAQVLAASGVRLTPETPPVVPAPAAGRGRPYTVVVIGSSTGGPEALATLFRGLGPGLRVPVLVAQHMPPQFTPLLAERLDGLTDLTVTEAVDGARVLPGQALVAPGDTHLELHRDGPWLVSRLGDGPRENFVRPAVDVLFRTAAAACGEGVLAAVLTGMGRDGALGAREVRAAGGTVLAQDRRTSVVWGMPGVVVAEGLADEVLPIGAIGGALAARVRQRV